MAGSTRVKKTPSKASGNDRTVAAAERLRAMASRRTAASVSNPLVPGIEPEVARAAEDLADVIGIDKARHAPEPPQPETPSAEAGTSTSTTTSAATSTGVADPVFDTQEAAAPTDDQQTAPAAAPAVDAVVDEHDGDAAGNADSEPGPEEPAVGAAGDGTVVVGAEVDTFLDDSDRPPATPPASPMAPAAGDPEQSAAVVEPAPSAEPEPVAAKTAPSRPRKTKAAAQPQARTQPAPVEVEELIWLLTGPESRLEMSGEQVKKMSLEMPLPLMDALARWELDLMKQTGKRLYRERLIDHALSRLPEDPEDLIEVGRSLPAALKYAETEQVGSRMRESIWTRLRMLRPEMKVRRTKGVYIRYVYAAAVWQFLTELGVEVETDS